MTENKCAEKSLKSNISSEMFPFEIPYWISDHEAAFRSRWGTPSAAFYRTPFYFSQVFERYVDQYIRRELCASASRIISDFASDFYLKFKTEGLRKQFLIRQRNALSRFVGKGIVARVNRKKEVFTLPNAAVIRLLHPRSIWVFLATEDDYSVVVARALLDLEEDDHLGLNALERVYGVDRAEGEIAIKRLLKWKLLLKRKGLVRGVSKQYRLRKECFLEYEAGKKYLNNTGQNVSDNSK